MRILLNVKLPHAEFNAAVRDGSVGSKINRILETMRPESIYFTEEEGHRAAVLVVDVANPSLIPGLAEPWFLTFNADVRCRVAMTPADLQEAGLDKIGKKWG